MDTLQIPGGGPDKNCNSNQHQNNSIHKSQGSQRPRNLNLNPVVQMSFDQKDIAPRTQNH